MFNVAREGGREYQTEIGSKSGLGDEGSVVMMGGYDPNGTPGQSAGLGQGPGLDSEYSEGVNTGSKVVSVVSKANPKSSSSHGKLPSPHQSPKSARRKSFGNDANKRPASYAYNNKNSALYDNHRWVG